MWELKNTPSSIILFSFPKLKIWKPPLSVNIAPFQPINLCKPPTWEIKLYPGLKYKWYELLKIIWMPSLSNSRGAIDLTVAWVPTGIKTGVSIIPWEVYNFPSLALVFLDSFITSNLIVKFFHRLNLIIYFIFIVLDFIWIKFFGFNE